MRQVARDGVGILPVEVVGPQARSRPKPLSGGFSLALAALLLAALALRLSAARGELWLDEIWSLNLVAPLRSAAEVFWGISHDNNHFLNSVWLYEAGPGRSSIVYRLPAVLLGTLSVLVAARIGLRRDAATALATGLLAASNVVLVNYGSEARGYAGLVLAILVAVEAFEGALVSRLAHAAVEGHRGSTRQRWILAGAIGFGTLSHLTMLSTAAVLGLAAAARFGRAGADLRTLIEDLAWLFWPSALLLVPAGAALAAGIVVRGGFTMGGAEPFSFAHFLTGYGDLLRSTVGLPQLVPAGAVLGLVAVAAVLAHRLGLIAEERRPLLAAALLLLPGTMLAARLPNLEYPRYFLVSGVILLLGLGDGFGRLWRRAGPWRWGGAVLLASIVGGQAWPLERLLIHGRGSSSEALTHIAREGGATYASNAPYATRTVVDHVASRLGLAFVQLRYDDCADPKPRWFIGSATGETDPPPSIVLGPPACRAVYGRDTAYPSFDLSGLAWTLYRLQGADVPRSPG